MSCGNSKLFKILDKVNRAILLMEEVLLTIAMIGLCGVIFIEVLCRYIFFISTAWSEELARYLFIALTFIGGAYACATYEHIEIDIINQVLERIPAVKNKKRAKKLVDLIGNVMTIVFLVAFNVIFYGYMMQIKKIGLLSPTMHMPMIWIYFIVFLGGVLSILHLLYIILCSLFKKDAE